MSIKPKYKIYFATAITIIVLAPQLAFAQTGLNVGEPCDDVTKFCDGSRSLVCDSGSGQCVIDSGVAGSLQKGQSCSTSQDLCDANKSLFCSRKTYTCIENSSGGCADYGFIGQECCSTNPNDPVCKASQSGGGNTGIPSGRSEGNTSTGGAAAGCQKSDDQCPAPNFCYINGVCVPVPKTSTGIVGASSVFELVTIVLKWLFTFAGIVATVYLIIGGYQYMTSAGNEEAAEQGRKTIVNAVIGIIAVVFAVTVITIITNTLSGDNPIGYVQKEAKV